MERRRLTIPADHYTIQSMFKRLCYLIAEGFEVCSVQAMDADSQKNAKILYRIKAPSGQWRLLSEEFCVNARESEACAERFLDYLHSRRAG